MSSRTRFEKFIKDADERKKRSTSGPTGGSASLIKSKDAGKTADGGPKVTAASPGRGLLSPSAAAVLVDAQPVDQQVTASVVHINDRADKLSTEMADLNKNIDHILEMQRRLAQQDNEAESSGAGEVDIELDASQRLAQVRAQLRQERAMEAEARERALKQAELAAEFERVENERKEALLQQQRNERLERERREQEEKDAASRAAAEFEEAERQRELKLEMERASQQREAQKRRKAQESKLKAERAAAVARRNAGNLTARGSGAATAMKANGNAGSVGGSGGAVTHRGDSSPFAAGTRRTSGLKANAGSGAATARAVLQKSKSAVYGSSGAVPTSLKRSAAPMSRRGSSSNLKTLANATTPAAPPPPTTTDPHGVHADVGSSNDVKPTIVPSLQLSTIGNVDADTDVDAEDTDVNGDNRDIRDEYRDDNSDPGHNHSLQLESSDDGNYDDEQRSADNDSSNSDNDDAELCDTDVQDVGGDDIVAAGSKGGSPSFPDAGGLTGRKQKSSSNRKSKVRLSSAAVSSGVGGGKEGSNMMQLVGDGEMHQSASTTFVKQRSSSSHAFKQQRSSRGGTGALSHRRVVKTAAGAIDSNGSDGQRALIRL